MALRLLEMLLSRFRLQPDLYSNSAGKEAFKEEIIGGLSIAMTSKDGKSSDEIK